MYTTAAPVVLPLIGHTLALTSALLTAWDYADTELGEHSLRDAIRLDGQRTRYGVPSILSSREYYLPDLTV